MAGDKAGLTSSDKGGSPQIIVTSGEIATPVEAFTNDAGAGKQPYPGAYGPPEDGSIPSGIKKPGGSSKALDAWFGSGYPGSKK